MIFDDREYAISFFDLVAAWNYHESDDAEDNICLSFILEEDHYSVFLYPSHSRPTVKRTLRNLKERARRQGPNAEPFLLVMSVTFCHTFSDRGALRDFLDSHELGDQYMLAPIFQDATGRREIVGEVQAITKRHLKVKKRSELGQQDWEWAFSKRAGH